MPQVSVIMATYNHAKFIAQAVESVVRQTFRDFELIVVVDGATDDTLEVLQPLQRRHGFVVETQENAGQPSALNRGLGLASGELIVPFDSDDIMLLDRLEKQVRHMAANPRVGIGSGNTLFIDREGALLKRQQLYPARTLDFDDCYLRRGKSWIPARMIRRQALDEIGGWHPDIVTEDTYLALKIASLGWKIALLPDLLAYYRRHEANVSDNLEAIMDGLLATYDCFPDHPGYHRMRAKILHTHLLSAAHRNKPLARKILRRIPVSAYGPATLLGLLKLLLVPAKLPRMREFRR